jgi:hypothetical protein
MRGGAQAHLLEGSDGNCYVVKFSNNPQHRRILVNEWIAGVFLRHLGLSSPEAAMVRVSEEFLEANADAYLQMGRERRPPDLGWHFGSRFPGDPGRTAVYDFLPDSLLDKVENTGDFVGALAFDKWAAGGIYRSNGGQWICIRRAALAAGGLRDPGAVFSPAGIFQGARLGGLRTLAGAHPAFSRRGCGSSGEADSAGVVAGRGV